MSVADSALDGASVARIPGLAALRPILDLVGEVRARHMRKIFGHVDGILVGQIALPQREFLAVAHHHIGLDEAGRRVSAGHAGADIEGTVAPQRREGYHAIGALDALAICAMADGALLGIYFFAMHGIGQQIAVDLRHAASRHLVVRLRGALHPVDIGDHRLQVGAVHGQRLAVHRAAEAAIDALAQADDLAGARRF